jgi:hypothetical protein
MRQSAWHPSPQLQLAKVCTCQLTGRTMPWHSMALR